jgi:hypothetical protein
MTRIVGATTRQIDQAGDDYAYLLEQGLDATARRVAADWLSDRATEETLATFIRGYWIDRVEQELAPTLALLLHTGAAGVRSQLRSALTASAETFHLPGKHNQQTHGHGGGYVGASGPPEDFDMAAADAKVADLQAQGFGASRDDALLDVLDAQGFTGHPEVVDQARFDQLEGEGWTVTYRGFKDNDQAMVDRYARDWAEGDLFPGLGGDGNGTYTSPSRDYVDGHINGWAGQRVVPVAIRPEAKVVAHRDLDRQMDAEWDSLPPTLQDPGRYAAWKGFDVIHKTRPSGDFYVILNRTATATVTP